jgi:drug/metabolite transporter (DMT)-like permease
MSKKMRGNLMLILTALIWGSAFVAQKSGMELIGPLAFNGIRTTIGGIVLIPAIVFLNNFKAKKAAAAGEELVEKTPEEKKKENKLLIIGGICCGVALMVASTFQQIGIFYTTAGKAGFITALYVVLVPICGLFIGKRVRPVIWACVVASAVGLYLLCMPAGGGGFGQINKGDVLIMICALCFTAHILVIDYFSPKVDGVKLSCIQFFVAGILSLILMFPLDPMLGFDLPTFSTIVATWLPILYAGVLSCGVAYTLQIVAQADTDPTIASMILCLESVFAVIAGMIILGESMSARETIGCLIMFVAIVVSQLPSKEERLAAKEQ